jgi:predicted enzyme related to lactoylglutathione lyase
MLNSAEAVHPEAALWRSERMVRGAFCWLGLATSDPAAARAFYTDVFDWDSAERPAGKLGTYTALHYEGKEVAILYQQTPEALAAQVAPHWTPYVAVEDADRSANLAQKLGGTLLREPQDLGEAGRVAPVQDPNGAVLSLWQPRSHSGAELMNDRGAICWLELVTPNLDRAAFFYCTLVGWRLMADPRVFTIVDSSFTITNAEVPIGTIREQRDDEKGISGGWIPYFGVESPEHTQRIATLRGGRTLRAASNGPIGHTSVLADPLGVPFGLLEHPAVGGRGDTIEGAGVWPRAYKETMTRAPAG